MPVPTSQVFTPENTPQSTPLAMTDIEAAVLLNLSVHTLRKMRTKGTGPAYLKMGKTCRYRHQDLKDYLEKSVVSR